MQSSIRVLHVDDEPDFAEMVSQFVSREDDMEVVTETDAREALELLDTEDIDCVVSDYEMPEMNGLELLDAVRDAHPDLPFLLFTGRGSEEVAGEAISRGATDYLQKGTGTEQYELLANRVRNAVEQHRSERRAAEQRRINEIMSEVNRSLVRASSREEVERSVCEILAGTSPYAAACVVRADDAARLETKCCVGADGYYEEAEMLVSEEPTVSRPPEERSLNERELSVCQNVREDPAYEKWRDAAEERGFRSLAAVPLEYGDELYGVLVVFAGCPDAFDETETKLLEEIADDVAYSLYTEELSLRERAMDEAPIGITISESGGEDNPLIYANDGFTELTGYALDEVIGRDCRFLQGEETDEEPVAKIRRAIDAEESVSVELRNYTEDGEEFWNRVSIAPLRGDGGEVTNYVGFQEDVTERKEHEQDLQRYRRMVNSMNEAACVYDAEGRFVVVNDYLAEFYGTTPDDLVGEPSNLVPAHPDDAYEELVEGERREVHGEVEKEFPGHGHAVLEYSLTRLTDNGEFGGVVGVAHDITEHKKRERAVERRNEMLEELAEFLSHDLRTPLSTVRGRLELALETDETEHVEKASAALDRVDEMLTDMVGVLRTGKVVSDTEEVDLGEMVGSVSETVNLPETASVEVVGSPPPRVEGDKDAVRRLLENLVSNSVEHGGESVRVRIGRLNGGFYYEDDGPGIPEENREEVFEPGFSTKGEGDGEEEDAGTGTGTGMGLASVRQVVIAHGWEISVEDSEELGGVRLEVRTGE